VGAVTVALVCSLALGAVYMIESHVKDLNKRRTEKARETKLKNLENNKALEVEEEEILDNYEREQKEKEQKEESAG